MPYLGRPFNEITTFGKVTEGNFDVKNNSNQWKKHSTLRPPDKLRFGLTHPDKITSRVRLKTTKGVTMKMSNLTKFVNTASSNKAISTFGKPSSYGSQFKTQSPQIQNRHGARLDQQRVDKNL